MIHLAIFKSNRLAFSLACLAELAIVFVSEYSYHKAAKTIEDVLRYLDQHFEVQEEDGESGLV